jgi:hypothetical protein
MNCESTQKKFLEMDNGSRIPVSVMIHTLYCSRCRHIISELSGRFASLRSEAPFDMDRDLCEQIMLDVFRSNVQYEHSVSGLQWGVAGTIILVSMFLIPFSDSFGWLRHYFGRGLEIPVSIVLGLALSIFALAGIFSNMEQIKKFTKYLPKKMH